MTNATPNAYPVPKTMKAWVLGNPEELRLVEKPVPEPGRGRGAGADRRDRGLRHRHRDHQARRCRRSIDGGSPFNKQLHARATNTWARW